MYNKDELEGIGWRNAARLFRLNEEDLIKRCAIIRVMLETWNRLLANCKGGKAYSRKSLRPLKMVSLSSVLSEL